jgi:hypothetical protein
LISKRHPVHLIFEDTLCARDHKTLTALTAAFHW